MGEYPSGYDGGLVMEKRRYLQEFTAVCRNCNGEGVKKMWRADDTLKQKPAVRSVCPVCEGSGLVKISGVRILTILPAKPQTVPVSRESSEIAGQARNDWDGHNDCDVSDCRRGAWSAVPKLNQGIKGTILYKPFANEDDLFRKLEEFKIR